MRQKENQVKRTHDSVTAIGALAGVLVIATAVSGCGSSKTGGPKGTGGAARATGGATATGGGGGAVPGTGGVTGATGTGGGGSTAMGSGGTVTGGSKGTGGAAGSGGTPLGTGGKSATGGSGAGGSGGQTVLPGTGGGGGGVDGGSAGSGTGGRATGGGGGRATGGAGGFDGGIPSFDGGPPDAPLARCSDITTETECNARSDCHSVFEDPHNCACAALGCCARFRACADGDKANCSGPAACAMPTPYCEGPYLVAYQGSCFEGCVKQTDCAPPPCPQVPPMNEASCGPVSQTCYYEDCAGSGRTVATCNGRAWQVTTGACTSVYCEPNVDSPYAITCAAGKVCAVTRSSGGAPIVTPMCVDHACGTGPISPTCIPSLSGTCTGKYSLGGAIIQCLLPSSCGDAGCA